MGIFDRFSSLKKDNDGFDEDSWTKNIELEESIIGYIEDMDSKDNSHVLINTLKKYISKRRFLHDVGYNQIAKDSTQHFYVGDILFFAYCDEINKGDFVESGIINSESVLRIYGEIKKVHTSGMVTIWNHFLNEEYNIYSNNILGVYIKSIPLGSDEWFDFFDKLDYDYEQIIEDLTFEVDFCKEDEYLKEKPDIINELEYRLKLVKEYQAN
jgi:hypothetical protein